MGYRIKGTPPEGAKFWKTSLKIGITTTSKMYDIHMSWSKQNDIVIVGVYSSWKCDNFTLLQRHIPNRLYRTYQHPHRYESISNWACRIIGMNTVHRNPLIGNYMVILFLVCIPHPVPTILQCLLVIPTLARWLLMDWFYSVRCHQRTSCSTAVGFVFAQSRC